MKYGFILICFLHITSALAGQGVKKNRAKSDFDIFLFKVSGKYFYVDRKIVKDKKAEDILRDSSLRFYELLFYKTDSNLAILNKKLLPLDQYYFQCGVADTSNQVKYAYATVRLLRKKLYPNTKALASENFELCLYQWGVDSSMYVRYRYCMDTVLRLRVK
jgi:hypothetical protein